MSTRDGTRGQEHVFSDGRRAMARRHRNPDGSLEGWVALTGPAQ